jgi:hypothetical protein
MQQICNDMSKQITEDKRTSDAAVKSHHALAALITKRDLCWKWGIALVPHNTINFR